MEEMILLKSQVFSSEWKTERVREDASGDREDGEDDDELPRNDENSVLKRRQTTPYLQHEINFSFALHYSDK